MQDKKNKSTKLAIPPLAIVDNIVISKNEAWAYYIISEKPYEYLSDSGKVALASATMTALGGIVQSSEKRVDCHLLITNQAFDSKGWYNQMREIYKSDIGKHNKVFERFVEEQAFSMYMSDYRKRVTYLGIKLTNRLSFDFSSLNPLEFGFKDVLGQLNKNIRQIFAVSTEEISIDEEKRLRALEKEYSRLLSNSILEVKKPSSENLLLTIKRRLYPSMPIPYLETNHFERFGMSDIVIESGGILENKLRHIKISQVIDDTEYIGYRATVSFSSFPRFTVFPSVAPPFLYRPSVLPFTVNARFTLMPTEYMKKEYHKKKLEAEDELANLQESRQGMTASVRDTFESLQLLERDLEDSKLPWISGVYRVTVEAPEEELLKNYISALKMEYAENDYVLSWTTGDQMNLLLEEFPGGTILEKDFVQTNNIALLGTSGLNFGQKIGDPSNEEIRYKRT